MVITTINQVIHSFLDQHLDPDRPVLLAFSGGPDSTVLLDLLLAYRSQKPLSLHLAHVDHQWRIESSDQAMELASYASSLEIPFHLKQIDPRGITGNLEDACRKLRLQYFSELCRQFGFQAVLFGHHADDRGETILKRLLEGASLSRMGAMEKVSRIDDMTLWRPLLTTRKSLIMQWANCRKLSFIDDKTNYDSTYLRARMRSDILPDLSRVFGKEVIEPLLRLGDEAVELERHLDRRIEKILNRQISTPNGILIDLKQLITDGEVDTLELKHLIRQLGRGERGVLSYSVVDSLCSALQNQSSNFSIHFGGVRWIADRSRLFIFKENHSQPFPEKTLLLEVGMKQQFEGWEVSVSPVNSPLNTSENAAGSWRECWAGCVSVVLPKRDYHLGPSHLSALFPGNSSLSKWLTDHKVPTFMRRQMPVIWEGDKIVHEFLTGKQKPNEPHDEYLEIELKKISAAESKTDGFLCTTG